MWIRAGWGAAKDTIDPLLGRPMDPELAADIDRIVQSMDPANPAKYSIRP